jgi:HEPN domain-containing protein
METADLIKLGEAIAKKISVEKIYCLCHTDSNTHHLIIIIPASCGTKFTELEPFVRIATNASKAITYTFYQTGEIRAALKKGNLLFHLACIEPNLLYNKADSPNLPQSKAENLLAWKREANAQFKDGAAKATAFLDGANFYSEKNDAGLTVFMLHQFIELTFRTLELALLAKEKKTHSITLHQALVIPLLPQLGVLFPADTSEEKEILKTLNNAYSAVRYEQNHQVNEAFIPTLFYRAYLLQKRAETIINELNALLDIKIKEAETLEKESIANAQGNEDAYIAENTLTQGIELTHSKNDKRAIFINNGSGNYLNTINSHIGKIVCSDGCDDDLIASLRESTNTPMKKEIKPELEMVVALIIEHLKPDQIYVFGSLRVESSNVHLFNLKEPFNNTDLHYDLLVISPLSTPYGTNIQCIVNEVDGVTINLFVHTQEEALKKLENRNRFFYTVFKHGNLVYSKATLFDIESIPRITKDENRNQAVTYCTRRILRAVTILMAAELVKDNLFEVTVFLLSQGIEQACLGLIYNFIGYTPNLHSLPHLLNICKMFWPEDEECFPMQTSYDKKLLALLSQSHSAFRYTVGKTIEQKDLDEVYKRFYSFIVRAEKLYISTLTEIEVQEYDMFK